MSDASAVRLTTCWTGRDDRDGAIPARSTAGRTGEGEGLPGPRRQRRAWLGLMAEGLLLVLAEMFEEKAEQKEAGEEQCTRPLEG